jgi:hypothetical protein
MHKHRRNLKHPVPRTTTKRCWHNSRQITTSPSKRRDNSNGRPHRPQSKAQKKHRKDRSLVAPKVCEQRCDWQKNKQQRTRGNVCEVDFATGLCACILYCCCWLVLSVLCTRHFVNRRDSGQRLNDGRLLEHYEWRTMDVKTKAWYSS